MLGCFFLFRNICIFFTFICIDIRIIFYFKKPKKGKGRKKKETGHLKHRLKKYKPSQSFEISTTVSTQYKNAQFRFDHVPSDDWVFLIKCLKCNWWQGASNERLRNLPISQLPVTQIWVSLASLWSEHRGPIKTLANLLTTHCQFVLVSQS